MIHYYSIKQAQTSEITIKKSRFICYLLPIEDETDFLQKLAEIKKSHYKATHHCYAYILNDDSSIQKSADDGEPKGTAGLPILEVLKQNELTYIMAVVVRYYGGIKLGAGGLIRAYSSAVSQTLENTSLIKNISQDIIEIQLNYTQNDLFDRFLQEQTSALTVLGTEYTDKVSYRLALDPDKHQQYQQIINDLLKGQMQWTQLGDQRVDADYIPERWKD
ncbi:uncharacterized protein, YigZ family [Ignavigranum ruoffiae]|uniref:Uncharacterized protein, YigZ family n=1 Tax=Ignavigranum ruoffiae TaxID=89093 RepID=A0A1H9DIF4_9LACT|nr:YigZ family protein [Ignavigranum ruoffiae]SEQ13280.1 uncharacterized protein, YigZ family [Ignavigranum ruoffiae]